QVGIDTVAARAQVGEFASGPAVNLAKVQQAPVLAQEQFDVFGLCQLDTARGEHLMTRFVVEVLCVDEDAVVVEEDVRNRAAVDRRPGTVTLNRSRGRKRARHDVPILPAAGGRNSGGE